MSLTIIILTYNEELHIQRCIQSVSALNANIIVVDSYSTDNTVDIANKNGAVVFQNTFVSQAQQFQWAIENCKVLGDWILRIDADETIDKELSSEILAALSNPKENLNGFVFNRKHIFLGKWIRYGGRYPLPMLRMFRRGTAHIEQRWMDEHIVLDRGYSRVLSGGFEDDNLNSVSWFIDKHNKYATREMIDIQLSKLGIKSEHTVTSNTGLKIKLKRIIKNNIYNKFPYFVRPILYFLFRYFLQLGFLDGSKGFAYHFMQGFWYRCLVDLKCLEFDWAARKLNSNLKKIELLEAMTGYTLSDK